MAIRKICQETFCFPKDDLSDDEMTRLGKTLKKVKEEEFIAANPTSRPLTQRGHAESWHAGFAK
jgi:hypothetical protein